VKEVIPNPHSLECYFSSLVDPHKTAVQKLGSDVPDRIVETTQNIRERISRREHARPVFDSAEMTEEETPRNVLQRAETIRKPITNNYSDDALVARGLNSQATPARVSTKLAQAGIRRRSTGHLEPLLPLSIINFFKTNIFCLLESYNTIRQIIYANLVNQDYERILFEIGKRLKIMDDTLLIDLQKYDQAVMKEEPVQIFTSKMREFIINSSKFWRHSLRICKNASFPPAQNLLDEFNKLYTVLIPIAKAVVQCIKGLIPAGQ